MADPLDPEAGYSFLAKAAAEARAASRRYWAKGGEADRKHPVQPMPYWPEPGTAAAGKAARAKRAKRKG